MIYLLLFLALFFFAVRQPIFAQARQSSGPLQQPPEESKEDCPDREGRLVNEEDETITAAPIYRDSAYNQKPGMREDAGLNFGTSVKGIHCGQVKSDPIKLEEATKYKLRKVDQCIVRRWIGQIQINYGAPPTINFRIPFAQEMADQWAGTWDAEHVNDKEMGEKMRMAAGKPIEGRSYTPTEAREAMAEIVRKSGVLKKLLPAGTQDELKCSFIDYIRRKIGVTMYAGFTIDGHKLTDIACPPTVGLKGPMTPALAQAYLGWFNEWGETWGKMGLYPNEKSSGDLIFEVCDDRQYKLHLGYPEAFRLGLAANTLFQVLNPESIQESFYTGEYSDMRDPLNSEALALRWQRVPRSDTRAASETPVGSLVSLGTDTGAFAGELAENATSRVADVRERILEFARRFLPSIEQVFAETVDKISPIIEKGSDVIAQATGQSPRPSGSTKMEFQPTIFEKNGKIEFMVRVQLPSFIEDDIGGDLYINGKKIPGAGYFKVPGRGQSVTLGSKGSGAQFPIWDALPKEPEKGYNISYHIVSNYKCYGGKSLCGSFTGSVMGAGAGNVAILSDGTVVTDADPNAGPTALIPPKGGNCVTKIGSLCSPECITKTCQFGCAICRRAQVSPSDTTIFDPTDNRNHVILGVDFEDGTMKPNPIKWGFNVNAWNPWQPYPDQCQVVCDSGGIYNDPGSGCVSTGFQFDVICRRTHDRIVDVFNNVPFLDSLWVQAAAAPREHASGFFNTFKIPSITGTGKRNQFGCSAENSVVFDLLGNVVPNPAASVVMYSFDQSAKGASPGQLDTPEMTNFGLGEGDDPEEEGVKVTMIEPKPGQRSKILFYRLGGVCNMNTWVSQKLLLPSGLAAGGVGGGGTTQPSAPVPQAPAPSVPLVSGGVALSNLTPAQIAALLADVGTQVSSLPSDETPTVATVTDASVVQGLPFFQSAQNGDLVVAYTKNNIAILYRPATKKVIAQVAVIPIALRNGMKSAEYFDRFERDLRRELPSAVIVERSDARRKEYGQTLLIDPHETKRQKRDELSKLLSLPVAKLPSDEATPSADFLIIVGGPRVALRDGTSSSGATDKVEQALKQLLPQATIIEKTDAALRDYQKTLLIDPSATSAQAGKRREQAAYIASKLGILVAPLPQGEPLPTGVDFLIIVGSDRK